ncbi:LA_2272 family surface repeat-containing protein [Sphingobacterium hungaricum]|nr:hypothetical protein [Sphingobacterium hungaricum]
MKTLLTTLLIVFCLNTIYGQKRKIFSLSPMTGDTEQVNGLVVGVGHFQESQYVQRVNGINIDLMVLSPMVVLYSLDGKHSEERTGLKLISNGLNLAVGGYMEGTVHNGLSFAMYNFSDKINGLSVNATYNRVVSMNGLHISGFGNFSESAHGINIGISNRNDYMKGIQLGVYNASTDFTGLQIGIYNKTNALSGLQLGFWNKNGSRSLPFINF